MKILVKSNREALEAAEREKEVGLEEHDLKSDGKRSIDQDEVLKSNCET